MKNAIPVIILLMASLAMGQEIKHAPTVEQCRADAKVWVDDRHEGRYAPSLTMEEMDARGREMHNCVKVDRATECAIVQVIPPRLKPSEATRMKV